MTSPVSIVTGTTLASSVEGAWGGLMLYEQIPGRPPWPLRMLLPEPRGTEGSGSAVGNEVLCVYEGGFLRKRVTRVDPGRRYDFEVVEQRLTIAGGIRLVGGSYSLRAITEGSTRVELETRYVGRAATAMALDTSRGRGLPRVPPAPARGPAPGRRHCGPDRRSRSGQRPVVIPRRMPARGAASS